MGKKEKFKTGWLPLWDKAGAEGYYEAMARRGLRLRERSYYGDTFEEAEPQERQYLILAEENNIPARQMLFAEKGWQAEVYLDGFWVLSAEKKGLPCPIDEMEQKLKWEHLWRKKEQSRNSAMLMFLLLALPLLPLVWDFAFALHGFLLVLEGYLFLGVYWNSITARRVRKLRQDLMGGKERKENWKQAARQYQSRWGILAALLVCTVGIWFL